MSGIAGLFSPQDNDRRTNPNSLSAAMKDNLTFLGTEQVDHWKAEGKAHFLRVHHGEVNEKTQPIFNEDGSLCILMSGEVFDYAQEKTRLMARGHQFEGEGNDPEYCLHLYEEYGIQAFEKLNGSFVLAILNTSKKELVIATDRLSSHPLYYYQSENGTLLFATQFRSLLNHQDLPGKIDRKGLFQFLAFEHVLWDRTLLKEVKAIPPASFLRFNSNGISVERYWKLSYREGNSSLSLKEGAKALAESLKKSVQRKLKGEHRFGLLLSGGIDSRIVPACCEEQFVTFTIGDYRNREVKIAERIAKEAGLKHVFLRRSKDHYADMLDEAIEIGGGMHRFDKAHLVGKQKKISNRCDVLLDTYGFDVRLKGHYYTDKTLNFAGLPISLPFPVSSEELHELDTWKRVPSSLLGHMPSRVLKDSLKPIFADSLRGSIRDILSKLDSQNGYNLAEFPGSANFRSLSTYLMLLAVRHYVTSRSIIFDKDLIELSLKLPPRGKKNGRLVKKALKRLSPKLAKLPNANTALRADLPPELEKILSFSRSLGGKVKKSIPSKKSNEKKNPAYRNGSWPNMAELIRHNEKLRKIFEQSFSDPDCFPPEIFDLKDTEQILRDHLIKGMDNTQLLLVLLTFGRWHKKYMRG